MVSTEDSNRVGGAELSAERRHGPQSMSWEDFTALLGYLERTYRNFTLIVRKKESGDVEVERKWLGLRNDAVIQPSPHR